MILYISPVLCVCQYGLSVLGLVSTAWSVWLVIYGLAVRGLGLVLVIFSQSCGNYPDPKSGQPLDPVRPGCITIFPALFPEFLSQPPTFAANHRVVELVVRSAPVEHLHTILSPHLKNLIYRNVIYIYKKLYLFI